MPIVGGLDIHRKQLTFDYLDTVTGEVYRGQVIPADRAHLRAWLARFAGRDDVAFALEGSTGLAHPEAREHPPESRQLLEGEQILAGQEREVTAEYLAGHAVGAAELAAVSDRDPQVPQRPPERVSRRRCPRQVPTGHHRPPARKHPTRG